MTYDMSTTFKYSVGYYIFMKQVHAYEISHRKEMESSVMRQGSHQRFHANRRCKENA